MCETKLMELYVLPCLSLILCSLPNNSLPECYGYIYHYEAKNVFFSRNMLISLIEEHNQDKLKPIGPNHAQMFAVKSLPPQKCREFFCIAKCPPKAERQRMSFAILFVPSVHSCGAEQLHASHPAPINLAATLSLVLR